MENFRAQETDLDLDSTNVAGEMVKKGSILDLAIGGWKDPDQVDEFRDAKDITGQKLREMLADKRGLLEELEKLNNPELNSKTFFKAIDELNDNWGIRKSSKAGTGKYKVAEFNLPGGFRLKLKIFLDMDNTLSFTGSV